MDLVGQVSAGRHEYRLRLRLKTLSLFLAVLYGVIAAIFLVLSTGPPHSSPMMLASAAFAAPSLYTGLMALRSRLVIDGTRVQIRGAVQTREFDLNQVEGYRTYQGRYQSFRVICLKDVARRISLYRYATDENLDKWLAGLKDLDQQDREQLLEKIDQDQELGETPEERRSALLRAKRITIAAWVVDGGVAAAFVWGPAEYRLAAMTVLALAPVVAAYLIYRQPLLYGIFKAKSDPRGEVSPLLPISGIGLLLGAARVNFISVGLLAPFIATGTLTSLVMFYPAARRSPRFATILVGLCLLSVLYGWGLAASTDTAADRSIPQTYTAEVLGGHVSRGSRSTSYYLELEPWGPYVEVNTQMQVSGKMYFATQPGDIVCLALHAGALHAPWYEAVKCENRTPQSMNP